MNQKSITTLFILFLILVSACAKTPPRSALDATHSAPLQQQLDAFARAQAAIPSLSAFVQVKLSGGGKSELFDAALLARPPDKLFLQILDDLGQERARVVADGARVLFYDAQKNRYEHITQNEAALKKFLRLPLSVEELIDRLLMRLPAAEVSRWEAAATNDVPDIAYWAQRSRDRLGLTGTPLRLTVYESLNAKGKLNYRVAYSGQEMAWSFRRPKIRLTLSLQEIDLRKRLEDGRFDTQPPFGATLRNNK